MLASTLRRGVRVGISKACYMNKQTLEFPVIPLRRRDKYEHVSNFDKKTMDKKLKAFRRQMFVYTNLKQDRNVFLQYRYN